MRRAPLFAAALCLACGGAGEPGEADPVDAAPAPADALPPCEAPATLVAWDLSMTPHALATGDDLPIITGFQGFIFAQVSLRAPGPLAEQVTLRSVVRFDDGTSVSQSHPGVLARETETDPFLVFFNDIAQAELYGREASLGVAVDTRTCAAKAEVAVRTVEGGFQAQDAGLPPENQ